ncbi:DNA-binding NtrC family response regulator [Desulfurispira natronophila]|uniref:DNA-binding NtrC family response regulator n=1 Tax=Desulfurispira natronophila TaxID=682562 RepID=A0A7W7Y622_9BACT|nr:DNA-binding NtrC family response regulator [Desulfurispira natronophila]
MTCTNATILVVEDDSIIGQSLVDHFAEHNQVHWRKDIATAREAILVEAYDILLLDMHLPDGEGVDLLAMLHEAPGSPQAIIMTAFPEHQMAVRTIKMGAVDYLEKPFDLEDLDLVVSKAIHQAYQSQHTQLQQRTQHSPLDKIVGTSAEITSLKQIITTVAASPDTTVLVTGETGTGKELVAQAIHKLSPRSDRTMVRVNCAALPPSLIEAELFGYEKGAYTDAKRSRKGYVEMAAGGTLFLDEVGELPLETQSKLLRLLEDKTFTKVGGEKEISVNARVVAATNRDLETMMEERTFRSDLYFRLNVIQIALPSLKQRPDDIEPLLRYYLAHYAQRLGKEAPVPDEGIIRQALAYHWPGNVRELRNFTERTVLLGEFPSLLANATGSIPATETPRQHQLKTLAELEREHIIASYSQMERNKTRTAAALGINRLTLRKKLEEYGIRD